MIYNVDSINFGIISNIGANKRLADVYPGQLFPT